MTAKKNEIERRVRNAKVVNPKSSDEGPAHCFVCKIRHWELLEPCAQHRPKLITADSTP